MPAGSVLVACSALAWLLAAAAAAGADLTTCPLACSRPQDRVHLIPDLLGEDVGEFTSIGDHTHYMVVLPRCGPDTGCCNKTSRCRPKNMTFKNITFFATRMHIPEFVNLTVEVHTECECVEESKKKIKLKRRP